MAKPHVCIKVSDIKTSTIFYEGLGYEVGEPIKCDSIGGNMIAFGVKEGCPTIELLETDGDTGFDHITVGFYDVSLEGKKLIEDNNIPELGVRTKLFTGPDGEKIEVFRSLK